jgi:hypothetical protein
MVADGRHQGVYWVYIDETGQVDRVQAESGLAPQMEEIEAGEGT